jgi:hypothetical protein
MAKRSTAKGSEEAPKKKRRAKREPGRSKSGMSRSDSQRKSSQQQTTETEQMSAGDALVKLLESPLVIDLLAVGAAAALAALAEHRFSRREGSTANVNTRRAMKAAGVAAASAIGRRLSEEWDEIRKASEKARAGEEA